MTDAVPELVLHLARGGVCRPIAPRTTLDRDHVKPLVGELLRHDRAGPPETDNDDILFRENAGHCYCAPPFRDVHSARPAILTGGSGYGWLCLSTQAREL